MYTPKFRLFRYDKQMILIFVHLMYKTRTTFYTSDVSICKYVNMYKNKAKN